MHQTRDGLAGGEVFLGESETGDAALGISSELAQFLERPVTDFRGERGSLGFFGLATDGKYLYFTWQEDTGDIWVMDVIEKR